MEVFLQPQEEVKEEEGEEVEEVTVPIQGIDDDGGRRRETVSSY